MGGSQSQSPKSRQERREEPETFYDIIEVMNSGDNFEFAKLKGKVVYGLARNGSVGSTHVRLSSTTKKQYFAPKTTYSGYLSFRLFV